MDVHAHRTSRRTAAAVIALPVRLNLVTARAAPAKSRMIARLSGWMKNQNAFDR